MKDITIRLATVDDAQQINEIYEKYILETAITFEYDPVPLVDFQKRIEQITKRFPYLVCCEKEKIVGYAYLGMFKERAAFGWDTEWTVYFDQAFQGKGAAKALYQALEEMAELMGYYNIYALITDTNERSKRFHEKFGFETVGLYQECGYKFNQWWGLRIMCKRLKNFGKEPQPVCSIHEIDSKQIEQILRKAEKSIQ